MNKQKNEEISESTGVGCFGLILVIALIVVFGALLNHNMAFVFSWIIEINKDPEIITIEEPQQPVEIIVEEVQPIREFEFFHSDEAIDLIVFSNSGMYVAIHATDESGSQVLRICQTKKLASIDPCNLEVFGAESVVSFDDDRFLYRVTYRPDGDKVTRETYLWSEDSVVSYDESCAEYCGWDWPVTYLSMSVSISENENYIARTRTGLDHWNIEVRDDNDGWEYDGEPHTFSPHFVGNNELVFLQVIPSPSSVQMMFMEIYETRNSVPKFVLNLEFDPQRMVMASAVQPDTEEVYIGYHTTIYVFENAQSLGQ